MEEDSDDREMQSVVTRLAFAALERLPTDVFIASMPLGSRTTLKELIEQWCKKEDIRGERYGALADLFPDCDDEFSTARFCWALHTEKTARELLGNVTEIGNIGELVYLAERDKGAERFGGMIEQRTLVLVRQLLKLHDDSAMQETALLHLREPANPSSRGGLAPDEPIVILCVAKEESLAAVAAWRRRSSEDSGTATERTSSFPPPAN